MFVCAYVCGPVCSCLRECANACVCVRVCVHVTTSSCVCARIYAHKTKRVHVYVGETENKMVCERDSPSERVRENKIERQRVSMCMCVLCM